MCAKQSSSNSPIQWRTPSPSRRQLSFSNLYNLSDGRLFTMHMLNYHQQNSATTDSTSTRTSPQEELSRWVVASPLSDDDFSNLSPISEGPTPKNIFSKGTLNHPSSTESIPPKNSCAACRNSSSASSSSSIHHHSCTPTSPVLTNTSVDFSLVPSIAITPTSPQFGFSCTRTINYDDSSSSQEKMSTHVLPPSPSSSVVSSAHQQPVVNLQNISLSGGVQQQQQQNDHQYVGHSGKAYILVEKKSVNNNEGMHMVKCSIRLKEGKSLLIKKQSEHTLTFKITPFTCATYTLLSSSGSTSQSTMVSRVLVTISELSSNSLGDKSNTIGNNSTITSQPTSSSKQAKQSYFVPDLQFIFGSVEEAKEFCEKITNNVYCYCADLVSSKIQKESLLKAVSPTDTKVKLGAAEGYIIRKNQKPHIKTYQKPSIIYAELLNKQLLFYTSHKKTKVADVIGCRVDFTREKYFTDFLQIGSQKNEHHKMAFTLNVTNENEARESLAFPSVSDYQRWLSTFSVSLSPETSSRVDVYDQTESEEDQECEEKGSEDGGEEGEDDEEIDEELALLLGLGGDTVVVHTDIATKEDVVGDAILELGEPDIFGKRKKNVFDPKGSFWKPPKNTTPSKHPSAVSAFTPPVSPSNNAIEPPVILSEVQILKNRVAELERLLEEKSKECEDLKKELSQKN